MGSPIPGDVLALSSSLTTVGGGLTVAFSPSLCDISLDGPWTAACWAEAVNSRPCPNERQLNFGLHYVQLRK
jgi:hypothetical protein